MAPARTGTTDRIKAGGITVELSRTGKVFFPDDGITKGDLIGYYAGVAARMLPLPEGDLGLTTFVKSTGGKGLHVHVPLDARGDFDDVRAFSRSAVSLLADRHPDLITTEQRRNKRGSRVYADIMHNAYAQTVVAPYSVRARPGAPVAVPLHWSEVPDRNLSPGSFTLHTVPGRLERLSGADDPWAGLTRRHYGLARPSERLARRGSR